MASKEKDVHAESVVVTRQALEAMLQPSPVLSFEQRQAMNKEKEEKLESARAQARERKLRMLKVAI